MELKGNYEKLANAIILQAVKDYRLAGRRLRKYPHTEELKKTVAEQARRRREREGKYLMKKDGGSEGRCPKRKYTREERILHRVLDAENVIAETENFFRSRWFGILTELDGEELLTMLRKERQNLTMQTK